MPLDKLNLIFLDPITYNSGESKVQARMVGKGRQAWEKAGKSVWKSQSVSLKNPFWRQGPFVAKQPRLNKQAPGAFPFWCPPLLQSFAVERVSLYAGSWPSLSPRHQLAGEAKLV